MNEEQLKLIKKGVSLIETLAKEKTNALLYTIEDRCFSDSLENYFYPVSVASLDDTVYKCAIMALQMRYCLKTIS